TGASRCQRTEIYGSFSTTMSTRETAMFQNLIDIIAAPSAAFSRLKDRPTVLLPLLLVVIATASTQMGYVLLTDRGFLIDQQIEQVAALLPNVSEAQLDQMREQNRATSTSALIISSTVGTIVFLLLIQALYALYLQI